MKQTKVCLFLVDKGNIFRYKGSKGRDGERGLTLLKYSNDESSRTYDENFWEYWKTDASYAKGDLVDFAFLFDDETSLKPELPPEFSPVNPTEFFDRPLIE